MAERNTMSMAQQKIYIAQQIWLHYYNDYLFEKGIITEQERNYSSSESTAGSRLPTARTTKMGQHSLAHFFHYYPVAIFAACWYSDDTTKL